MPERVLMRQDTHARWNADWTSICTAASQAGTSAGISGGPYQWGEHEQLQGFPHRVCVIWAKQMQEDCNGKAGWPSNNPASWKSWARTIAGDFAEECWSQGAQWLSAQPIWLKRPGGLVLTHFRPPGTRRGPASMCPHKSSLSWTHYTMLTDEGEEKTVPWMKKRLSSDL